MLIIANGAPVQTVAASLASLLGDLPPGRAVAVNGEVVPRSAHHEHPLTDGDVVDIVEAVAGG